MNLLLESNKIPVGFSTADVSYKLSVCDKEYNAMVADRENKTDKDKDKDGDVSSDDENENKDDSSNSIRLSSILLAIPVAVVILSKTYWPRTIRADK